MSLKPIKKALSQHLKKNVKTIGLIREKKETPNKKYNVYIMEFYVKNEDYLLDQKTNILKVGLSIRTMNVLMACEIYTLEDLLKFKQTDLYKFRNCGKKTVQEIIEKLKEAGIYLEY